MPSACFHSIIAMFHYGQSTATNPRHETHIEHIDLESYKISSTHTPHTVLACFIAITTMFRLISLVALFASAAVAQQELHFLHPSLRTGGATTAAVTFDDAMLGHYGKPPTDCEGDEKAFQISGVPGMVCAPTCDASGGCPTDLPDGVTARPQCALENRSTGEKYCVLICTSAADDEALGDGMCGDASCQMVQAGLGICTWAV